jgi:hypothetical protein
VAENVIGNWKGKRNLERQAQFFQSTFQQVRRKDAEALFDDLRRTCVGRS